MSTEQIKPKQYHIDTFEKLVNVINSENIDKISIDFLIWLNYITKVIDKTRKEMPQFADKTNWELLEPTFIWIDDGENKIDHVRITNKDTGEVTEISLQTPKP